MFMSAFWHGAHAGYYLCIMSVPPHMVVEDLYVKLFMKTAGPHVSYLQIFERKQNPRWPRLSE